MESLKSQSEQCIFILTTKIENLTQLNYLSDSIRKYLFEKKSFPILLSYDIKSVPKIANTECALYKVLQKIPFPIDYNKKFLEEEILSKPILIQQAKDYISMLILHFYLSFFRTYDHDADDVAVILKSLLLIIQNKVSNNEKYIIYAISGFTTIILEKQFQINYSDSKFLSCVSDFFSLPSVPQESLTVLHYMLEKIGNVYDNDIELSNVLQIVNYAFQKYRPFFSNQFVSTIFLNLRFQLINLNYIVLSFFYQLSEILNEQDSEMYIKAFPAALIPYYDKCLKDPKNEINVTKINFYDTYTSQNSKSVKVSLPLSFKDDPPNLDQNKFDLKSINCKVFNLIMSIAKSRNKKFVNQFIEQVIKTLQLQNIILYYELLAIYIHFLIQLSPISKDLLESTRFLFEAPYFQNPIFIEDPNNSKPTYYLDPNVSSIRYLIMNFLFRQDFNFIQSIYQNFIKRNLIFPEFCYRSIYIDEEFKHPELSSLLFELYSIQISTNSEEGKNACLVTLKNYINTAKLRLTFFDNNALYKYVFSFINIHQERREFILEFIADYFSTCRNMLNYNFTDNMIRTFNNICDICSTNMIDENLSFILDIIRFSTRIMQMNNLLIEHFESFFDKICILLQKLPQNDPISKLIFTHSFSLFSVHHITQNESNAIEASAISLFGLTPNLKQLIVSLMGAENENQTEFIIKQPKAILLFIRIFKDDPTIWSFLSNLCHYSPINSIFCHETGVDNLLIEQLLQYKVMNDLKNQKNENDKKLQSEESSTEKNLNDDNESEKSETKHRDDENGEEKTHHHKNESEHTDEKTKNEKNESEEHSDEKTHHHKNESEEQSDEKTHHHKNESEENSDKKTHHHHHHKSDEEKTHHHKNESEEHSDEKNKHEKDESEEHREEKIKDDKNESEEHSEEKTKDDKNESEEQSDEKNKHDKDENEEQSEEKTKDDKNESEEHSEGKHKIKQDTNDDEEIREKIKELLTFFYEISKYSSSINVVNRYMSLLCSDPINNRVSDYHMMFVKLIHQLARETQKIPMTAFYEPQTFSNVDIVYDWTVCIWIFVIDHLDCPFFSASKGDFCYEISIRDLRLILNVNKSKTEYQFDYQLPLYDWVCLTFIVNPQDTSLQINGEEKCTISHDSFFINSADFVFNSSSKLLVGGITIYNTGIKENLYKKGPRRIWKDPENTLSLAIRPHVHNNQLETEIYIPKEENLIRKEFKKAFPIMNFIDILCERCGITLILPLLAQIVMKNADPDLMIETLDIIHHLLLYRNSSQKKFKEMSGIRIISHLITYGYDFNVTDGLNYKIYSKLIEIYSTLYDEKSKQKFLKYILVNLMIWVHCTPQDVVKIMTFLATQDKVEFWKYYKLNYSLTISAFRVYFSHNDYQNVPKFKGTEKEMYQVRQDLITFSRDFCGDTILNSDFLIVISHLKYSADMSKEIDLFRFLEEIIHTDFQKSKNIKPESKMMICYLMRKCIKTIVDSSKPSPKLPSKPPKNPRLHSRVNYNILCDFNLLIEVIKLFYDSIYQHFNDELNHFTIEMTNNRGNRNIYKKEIVYFLMRWVSDSFIDASFLHLLIPLINDKYPLLFPLGAMISVSLGEQTFKNFLNEVKLKKEVPQIDNLWPLWIIVGIFDFSLDKNKDKNEEEELVENEGIEFLLNNAPVNQWENIFLMIINFSLYKRYSQSNVKILFLRSLSKRIDNEEKCEIFIKLAMYQIYFRKYEMKLNRKQTITIKYDIADDDENENGKTFTENSAQLNFPKIRSSIEFQKNQSDKSSISRRLSNFTSKESYSRFISPSTEQSNFELENHVETIDPKKNKKVSMKTIDDLFEIIKRGITDFKCIHEIKSDEKNTECKWFDLGLANRIVDKFLTFPSKNYIDDVIIVEAYRLKYASDEDKILNKYVISAIEPEKVSERYSISYFNKICKRFNIESPFKQNIVESHLTDQYRKKKVKIVNEMKNVYDIFSKPSKNSKKIFKYYADDLAESTHIMFKQTIHDYLASVGLRMTKSKNKWNHLCATMMQGPEAPWHFSIKHEKVHFRRDFSSCYCFCPFKMKINHKYDQHLIASFKRNTGSQKTAEELYDKFLQKQKSKETHNSYYDIQDSKFGEEVAEEAPKIDTDVSRYIFTADCQIIKMSKEIDACFMLSKDGIVIQTETKVKKYPFYSIELILLRDYLHRPTAIEIFIKNGVTIFLNFTEILNNIVTDQIQCQVIQNNDDFVEVQQCTSNEAYFKSKKLTQMWCENKISNFEYLILLNIYSGRSFNNASQYPFMPWVIFDYESKKINPLLLRDLQKPIGAVNKERLDKLILSYEEKKECGLTPFLYSSGPMCPLALYYWLVRVEPFTTCHIEMQDGSFDHSDRVFASWQKAKKLITTMEDMYRELPPEAFFSHDFLVNYNEISLGIDHDKTKKKNDENLNSVENFNPSSQDVLLPPWASSPIEFIYMNRKVLESEIVSENLNSWIDLIWGYKQKGPEAEKALNVFRPEMYHDIWLTEEGKDENNWPIIETYLSQVGQIPIQLFKDPHPKKRVFTSYKMSIKINEMKNNRNIKNSESSSDFSNELNEVSSLNQKTNQPIRIRVDEVQSFIGAQIVTKRKSSNEVHLSLNYLVIKNEINISGLSEDGEVTNIKIGYKSNDVQEQNTNTNKPKKFQLAKNLRSKGKTESSSSLFIDANNISYNTEVSKKRYNLTSNVKRKKNSLLTQKFVMKFTFIDESKICYYDNVQNVLIFDDLKRKVDTEMLINQNKVTALAFDGEVTVAAFDSDGFLSIMQIFRYSAPDNQESFALEVLYTIPSFYERINCCDISKDFHQVVCGSSDGYILLFSLSNQTFLRTIKLDEGKIPQFIKITKSWGFIFCVLTEISDAKKKTFLAVWTINGDFIKMKEIDYEITKITTWRSKSGFDYFLFSTLEYNIIAGEVFTLENFFESSVDDEVISLGYDYDLENAIVLSKNGIISLFPCSAPPPEF